MQCEIYSSNTHIFAYHSTAPRYGINETIVVISFKYLYISSNAKNTKKIAREKRIFISFLNGGTLEIAKRRRARKTSRLDETTALSFRKYWPGAPVNVNKNWRADRFYIHEKRHGSANSCWKSLCEGARRGSGRSSRICDFHRGTKNPRAVVTRLTFSPLDSRVSCVTCDDASDTRIRLIHPRIVRAARQRADLPPFRSPRVNSRDTPIIDKRSKITGTV